MEYCFREEEDDEFFDARGEISSMSDCSSDCSDVCSSAFGSPTYNGLLDGSEYGVWSGNPGSVEERRQKFRKWMGLSFNWKSFRNRYAEDCSKNNVLVDVGRITLESGAVLRTCDIENVYSSTRSFQSCQVDHAEEFVQDGTFEDTFDLKAENFCGEMEPRVLELGSDQSMSSQELQQTWLPSVLSRMRLSGELNRLLVDGKNKIKRSWVRRKLGAIAHVADRDRHSGEAEFKPAEGHEVASGTVTERIRVYTHGKRSKELSFIGGGQQFRAHEGSILTMKFSLDGHYLASGGEDGIVRVWRIIEDEMCAKFDTPEVDPSCVYFRMDHVTGMVPLNLGDQNTDKAKKQKRPSDTTCVIFPSKVFRISEKPVHEFEGHSSEILDLSWSKEGFLLSSSADKTVRLWQVGCDRCLRVFNHNNYVTSVAFNPVDGNYFMSGSIDGKVRIWEVPSHRVVHYTDIRDIVTAVCYRPDGKGGIVGSINGNCYFYDIIDNQQQLDAQTSLHRKKRSPGKRITGFQFSPSDPAKLAVTSADGLIRVLSGINIISTLKASCFNISSGQVCANFTRDGKHIVSASEDSNVYVWNHFNQKKASSRTRGISSYESFPSHNVSVAIPWCGTETMAGPLLSPKCCHDRLKHRNPDMETGQNTSASLPKCFPLRKVALESFTRNSATWPEESLDTATISPAASKSDSEVLKSTCQSMLSSHLLGLVIVTAGRDGWIRTYCNYGLPVQH